MKKIREMKKMGERAQVYIKNEGVYLYTHWGAWEIISTVQKAIAKKLRWDDQEYLARIIFEKMIKNAHDKETGFGIGNTKHGDIQRLITIEDTNIKIEDYDKIIFEGAFEKFIETSFAKYEEM